MLEGKKYSLKIALAKECIDSLSFIGNRYTEAFRLFYVSFHDWGFDQLMRNQAKTIASYKPEVWIPWSHGCVLSTSQKPCLLSWSGICSTSVTFRKLIDSVIDLRSITKLVIGE